MTRALIDADLVAFRCAASAENDPDDIAILRCDKLLNDIADQVQAEEVLLYLTGKGNFRKEINPDYKANRKDKPLPKHLNACRDFLTEVWEAVICNGVEADDVLGYSQTKDTVICSLDKDLLQIPGKHYNWVKGELYDVPELVGIRHFYKQMLIGDRADNLFGVEGIGKVKADRILNHLNTEREMMQTVCSLYNDPDRFQMNADCFWIMRKEGEMYSDRKV